MNNAIDDMHHTYHCRFAGHLSRVGVLHVLPGQVWNISKGWDILVHDASHYNCHVVNEVVKILLAWQDCVDV